MVREIKVRKPLPPTTWVPRKSLAEEDYELKRKLEGSARRGERTDLTSAQCAEVWTQDKTAEDLGISRRSVGEAIQAETLVKEYPELADLVPQ